ncbi:protein NRT1/ PTR FAMILY 2.11-like [Zingiber officinale]|uniref:protein NRT1/ PTR FAMILY 2.11-like n=1 Tax=Zingiber officinale TaxID=94328 RepID=UPI001C4DCDE5|nr:protein NRT1/ PTR FAMILY 2.11-like [Zingiber officinale]
MERKEKDSAVAEVKINHRGWATMPYILGNGAFENLGTSGTSSNLLVYLTTVFHMKSVTAAVAITAFNGSTNLAPLAGAFISDSVCGRYATLGFACLSTLLGLFVLTLSAAVPKLHPGHCHDGKACNDPTAGQLAVLFASFMFLVMGAGGVRPCNLAFGADQFDSGTEPGKRNIKSFFNWYYFTLTVAMVISSTVIVYVQSNVNWALGLAIPTLLMAFACAFFFLGSRMYVKVRPEGSPLTGVAQVLVAAFRKRSLPLPESSSLFNPPHLSSLVSKLPHTGQFRFLDKAAILTPTDEINQNGSAANGWRLGSVQQVEQVKCLVRIMPICFTIIAFQIALAQQSTYGVFQAVQSDRRLGNFYVPAASFYVFSMVAITIWIPIYDRFVIPQLQRITGREGGITLLQRMGVGLILGVASMLVAGLVEERRRRIALRSSIAPGATDAVSPMSSFWLAPQMVLMGLGEVFALIGQIDFCYSQFPENMRSLAGSMMFLTQACASYSSSLLITVIHRVTGEHENNNWLASDLNEGRLDLYYFLIAALGGFNFVIFVVCAKWYRYKSSEKDHELALHCTEETKAAKDNVI